MSSYSNLNYTKAFRASTQENGVVLGTLIFLAALASRLVG